MKYNVTNNISPAFHCCTWTGGVFTRQLFTPAGLNQTALLYLMFLKHWVCIEIRFSRYNVLSTPIVYPACSWAQFFGPPVSPDDHQLILHWSSDFSIATRRDKTVHFVGLEDDHGDHLVGGTFEGFWIPPFPDLPTNVARSDKTVHSVPLDWRTTMVFVLLEGPSMGSEFLHFLIFQDPPMVGQTWIDPSHFAASDNFLPGVCFDL